MHAMEDMSSCGLVYIVSPSSAVVDLNTKSRPFSVSTEIVQPSSSPPSARSTASVPIQTTVDLGQFEPHTYADTALFKIDIFNLAPVSVLKLMCASVGEMIITIGEVSISPRRSRAASTQLYIVNHNHDGCHSDAPVSPVKENRPRTPERSFASPDVDGTPCKDPQIGSPISLAGEPCIIIGANVESSQAQHEAIIRKFYSKKSPTISLEDYVLRIHRYCPMSTGVFLATSLYLSRLTTAERKLHITHRNVHRLLLGALRVAVKALEDRSFPHRRFAKVGGVSEAELKRLEISFCFLTNFDLKVNEAILLAEAIKLREAHIKRLQLHSVPSEYLPRAASGDPDT